jgi:hypothetical protein
MSFQAILGEAAMELASGSHPQKGCRMKDEGGRMNQSQRQIIPAALFSDSSFILPPSSFKG